VSPDELGGDERAVGESVTDVVTIGATLLIGVLIMSQFVATIPPVSNGPFAGAHNQIVSILNSSFLLAAILPVVVVAGAVLAYLQNFRGRR